MKLNKGNQKMAKEPNKSMQKFLERRKKENEENAVDYILLAENEEFKQAFVKRIKKLQRKCYVIYGWF